MGDKTYSKNSTMQLCSNKPSPITSSDNLMNIAYYQSKKIKNSITVKLTLVK